WPAWDDYSKIVEWPAWDNHSTIVEWPARPDHSTIVEWFDARTTRRLVSGLLGPTTRQSSSGSMLGTLDNRQVACSGRRLDDRRAVCEFGLVAQSMVLDDWSFRGLLGMTTRRSSSGSMVGPLDDHQVVPWSDHLTIIEWPAWDDHSTIVEWPALARTSRQSSSGLLLLGPLDDRRAVCEFGWLLRACF
ncbi:hypothetical protein HID58_087182, partial [Brassica napus]